MSETLDAAVEIREAVKSLVLALREEGQLTREALAEIRDMLSLIQHNLKRYEQR